MGAFKGKMIAWSVVLHLAVAISLLFAAERKYGRRATQIAVVDEKKKEKPKEKPKPPEPPRPPKPKPAAPKPAAEEPKPVTPTAPPPPPSHGPAPVDTGLTMGNDDGPGIAVNGPARPATPAPVKKADATAPGPKKTAPAPKRDEKKDPDEECQEEASKPEAIAKVKIEYTDEARSAGIEGRVIIRFTIDKDGTIAKSEVIQSIDPQFDAAIIAAVTAKWRFKPSMRCGRPMAGGIFTLARTFELGD